MVLRLLDRRSGRLRRRCESRRARGYRSPRRSALHLAPQRQHDLVEASGGLSGDPVGGKALLELAGKLAAAGYAERAERSGELVRLGLGLRPQRLLQRPPQQRGNRGLDALDARREAVAAAFPELREGRGEIAVRSSRGHRSPAREAASRRNRTSRQVRRAR